MLYIQRRGCEKIVRKTIHARRTYVGFPDVGLGTIKYEFVNKEMFMNEWMNLSGVRKKIIMLNAINFDQETSPKTFDFLIVVFTW